MSDWIFQYDQARKSPGSANGRLTYGNLDRSKPLVASMTITPIRKE